MQEITGQPLQLLQAPQLPPLPQKSASTTTFKKHKDQLLQLQQLQTPHHPSCSKGNTAHFTAPPYNATTTTPSGTTTTTTSPSSKSVSILVYKTLNTVVKSGRKIIVRVCEVANTKKTFKMFNAYKMKARANQSSSSAADNGSYANNTGDPKQSTGHDRFCQIKLSSAARAKRNKRKPAVRRASSANDFDFDPMQLSAANRRELFSRNRSASSEHDHSDQSEHSEKSPLVSARLDSLARLFFSRSLPSDTTSNSRETIESVLTTRPNVKYQYSALDSGNGVQERSPRERANRERAYNATVEWVKHSNDRYEIIAQMDEIGSRHTKSWFLISDATVRTDRLMTLLPLPRDCIALDELPATSIESPKEVLMELLSSLHHPYIYPTLDLGFVQSDSINYACLMTPFNPRGSLKDLIYKSQWNEPWNRKYTKKPQFLPITQIQRLGRQILEALLFLKERGFPLHGHLHSGNVILQNGVARLAGLENSLLGLSSRINAIMWSRTATDLENIDIICFGHLLYEMCTGQEMTTPKPSTRVLEMDLDRYPQILEIMLMIFDPADGVCPTVEELVLCDLFRNIDLRELRGACTIKPSLSRSTLNLLHSVRKKQISSLGRSFSEASSPCTPPSTPQRSISHQNNHIRTNGGTMDSFDDMSSDSEDVLDEVVVTSTCSSPIHICDQSPTQPNQPTVNGNGNRNFPPLTNITNTLPQIATTSFNNHQLTADICNYKNSKSRRLEYSLKCLKYGRSNPSQDSAFGSLTETDLSIGSSSIRLNSFQSISSPIDEGVEDIIISDENEITIGNMDSAVSSPCREGSVSPRIRYNTTSSSTSNLQFDPPKILVNDQNSIYTTSPSKRNGTVEVFSQKYRVSSIEDMSPYKTSKETLKNVNRVAFRSLEEERRIDNAFTPIKDRTHSENIHPVHKDSEKYKKLTHQSFRISNSLEPPEPTTSSACNSKNMMWKDSRFYRKSKIAKSNDSLLTTESPRNGKLSLLTTKAHSSDNHYESEQNEYRIVSRNKSAIEIATTAINSTTNSGGHMGKYHFYKNQKTHSEDLYCYRSERQLFNLFKLKQTAITTSDYNFDDENYPPNPSDNNRYTPSPVLPTPIPTPSPSTSPLKKIRPSCKASSSLTLSAAGNSSKNNNFRSLDFELSGGSQKERISGGEDDDSSTENTPSMSHKELCKIMKQCDGNTSGGSGGESSGVSGSSVEEKTPLLDSIEMSPISSPNEDESDEIVM